MPRLSLRSLLGLTLVVVNVGLTAVVAIFAYRSAMAAQRDRLWVAMAREAAHQMGTPLTSLQGWIERVRSSPDPPTDLADHLSADAERLDRVARRFERIGNPARRDPVALGALAEKVVGYYRTRLPRHANAIAIEVDAPRAGPVLLGDPAAFKPFTIEKPCGGFHPDYAVDFRRGTAKIRMLICFGCGEVKVFSQQAESRLDLSAEASQKLAEILKGYRKNRPPQQIDAS